MKMKNLYDGRGLVLGLKRFSLVTVLMCSALLCFDSWTLQWEHSDVSENTSLLMLLLEEDGDTLNSLYSSREK